MTRQNKDQSEPLAERSNNIEGLNFEAVAGNDEKLTLSLFTLIPESSASLSPPIPCMSATWQMPGQVNLIYAS